MTLGYIGLGKMGKNMVLHLLEQGFDVIAWNRSPEPLAEVQSAGATTAKDFQELIALLPKPRILWCMLPAGNVLDEILEEVLPLLESDDIVIDGGNALYKDSIRRNQKLKMKGIHFVDIGVSGGPDGGRHGACLMVGGDKKDYAALFPLIKAVAAPEAYGYMGPVGSGHFVKMIHNGIEYGMMQAIAEGAAILAKSNFQLNLAEVFRIYNNRSVIESRLIGWVNEALQDDPKLVRISSKIDSTGEGEWTLIAAKELGVDTPVIQIAVDTRKLSVSTPENFRNKVISALRGKFGHHKVTKD